MRRRTFVASTLAAAMAAPAFAANGQSYRQGLVEEELAAGRTVFLDFYTDWCTTCRAQGKAIRDLMDENPAYEANVSFIKIDWDQHAQSSIATRLNIPRRSTLVVLKGDKELGRIVAGTRKADIKALMDTALAAASA
ncbi:thioredoxin family protein [Silicimonas sp. MF1-12-2]|jgi:thiol:disulfide interchange protein|uniref:thioredoxin family protein n=1 Tax=Silicimonas sp. MF1-12-2 TaxID=3384793 RepID=UPI0039B36DD3